MAKKIIGIGNPSAVVCTYKACGLRQQFVGGRIRGVGVELVSFGTQKIEITKQVTFLSSYSSISFFNKIHIFWYMVSWGDARFEPGTAEQESGMCNLKRN